MHELHLLTKQKKCTFNDNTCSVDEKIRLDLYDYSSADSENCQILKHLEKIEKVFINQADVWK